MFKIFIAYLARTSEFGQNLPVIIAISAIFCTHVKHCYVPSESLFSKHRNFFNGENWPILHPKKKKKKVPNNKVKETVKKNNKKKKYIWRERGYLFFNFF